jgi:YVTN family beta-propeller protein
MNSLRLKKMTLLALSAVIISATMLFTASSPIVLSPVQAQAKAASSTELAYVTNKMDKTISIIDTATQTVVDTIFIGRYVKFIAVTPDGKEAYVGAGDGTVSVIDTQSRKVTHTISIGGSAYDIAVTPDGKEVYAGGHDTIFVIDTKTHEISKTIPIGDPIFVIAITPDGKQAYVSTMGGVLVIDTKTYAITHTIMLGDDPRYMPSEVAITPDGKQVYVDNRGSLLVIGTATKKLIKSIPTGENVDIDWIVFTPDGKKAYAIRNHLKSEPPRYEIAVIDTKVRQVIRNMEVAGHPYGMDITSNGKQIYITDVAKDLITVMDTQTDTISGTIPVGDHPVQVVIAPSPQ